LVLTIEKEVFLFHQQPHYHRKIPVVQVANSHEFMLTITLVIMKTIWFLVFHSYY